MIDWSLAATAPQPHQIEGVEWLVRATEPEVGRVIPHVGMLGDTVGAGKSKQTVDTAQVLFLGKVIDCVLCLAQAAGRGIWVDEDPAFGEVAKHGWPTIDNQLIEYSRRRDRLPIARPGALPWVVANYELVRRPERLLPLISWLKGKRYWIVADESWGLADQGTAQWRAAAALKHHGWIRPVDVKRDPSWKAIKALEPVSTKITLLNGTPVADSPLDLFAQGLLMHSSIPGFKFFSHFRARYAVMRPHVAFPQITGWQNLPELTARFKPYTLRREVEQCEVLEPIVIEAPLDHDTWRMYKEMKKELIAILDDDSASTARQAFTKGLRLAQITSGFLGGVAPIDDPWAPTETREIGREKIDALIAWLSRQRAPRMMVWSRFRPEIERSARLLAEGGREMHMLYGNQTPSERAAAIRALNPDVAFDHYVGVVGHAAAGGAALNFSGADLDITLSHDFSLRVYVQKRGRINRGRKRKIQYVDVVATGPDGQRTIDHHVLSTLRRKQDVASWTTDDWRRIATETV